METRLGSFAFSVCGEHFDDDLAARIRELDAERLLNPMARCFSGGSYDQERWDRQELPAYAARVRLTGTTTLMANYLADASLDGGTFGGAWVIAGDGTVLASLPLGRSGLLAVEL